MNALHLYLSHSNKYAFNDALSPRLLSFLDDGRRDVRRCGVHRDAQYGVHHGDHHDRHALPLRVLRVLRGLLKSERWHVYLDVFQASDKTLAREVSLVLDTLHRSSFKVQFHLPKSSQKSSH